MSHLFQVAFLPSTNSPKPTSMVVVVLGTDSEHSESGCAR
jgi:hypothetical protein